MNSSILPRSNDAHMRKKRNRSTTTLDTLCSQSSDEHDMDESWSFENAVKVQRKGSIRKVPSSPWIFDALMNGHQSESSNELTSPQVQTESGLTFSGIDLNGSEAPKSMETQDITRVASLPSMHIVSSKLNTEEKAPFDINPVDYLKAIISSNGFDPTPISSLDVKNYFEPVTSDQIAMYDLEITHAVRRENLQMLKAMKATGRMMQCCNRFGESIVHMACRRGSISIVTFLIDECGSSIRLRDDYGRTPLHDACWTVQLNFEIIKKLLLIEPDLILMSDKRGHTPLDYVRKDSWEQCCQFLDENRNLLVRKLVPKFTMNM